MEAVEVVVYLNGFSGVTAAGGSVMSPFCVTQVSKHIAGALRLSVTYFVEMVDSIAT